jgi:hypothetical protein
MGFPKEIFGKCPECGGHAGDDPTATGADTPATDVVGSGYPLEYYNGRLMCQLCIKRLKADEESRINAEKQAAEERFRGSAGFVKTIT